MEGLHAYLNQLRLLSYTHKNRMGGLNNGHLFLIDLKAGNSQIKVQADLVLGEGPRPSLQVAVSSLYPHVGERILVSLPLLLRALVSSWRHHSHDFI